MTTWKYLAKGGEWGPMSEEELRQAIAHGDLKAETPVQSSEDGAWKEAGKTIFQSDFLLAQQRRASTPSSSQRQESAAGSSRGGSRLNLSSVILIVGLGYLGYQYVLPSLSTGATSQSVSNGQSGTAATAPSVPHRTVPHSSYGCKARTDTERLSKLVSANDMVAANRFLGARLTNGDCRSLELGEKVTLDEQALWSGLVCIRPVGEPNCFWTLSDNYKP